jgi:hypothetical protein
MSAFTDFQVLDGDKLQAALKAHADATGIPAVKEIECPDGAIHGSPHRYCTCGWMETDDQPVNSGPVLAQTGPELTLEDKVEYLYAQAKSLESLVAQAGPLLAQAGPLLAQAGPMLDSLGPLLGQASSPMGRIFGSLVR